MRIVLWPASPTLTEIFILVPELLPSPEPVPSIGTSCAFVPIEPSRGSTAPSVLIVGNHMVCSAQRDLEGNLLNGSNSLRPGPPSESRDFGGFSEDWPGFCHRPANVRKAGHGRNLRSADGD